MDNDIFSGNGGKYCSLVFYYNNFPVFWCKSVIFDLQKNNNNDVYAVNGSDNDDMSCSV